MTLVPLMHTCTFLTGAVDFGKTGWREFTEPDCTKMAWNRLEASWENAKCVCAKNKRKKRPLSLSSSVNVFHLYFLDLDQLSVEAWTCRFLWCLFSPPPPNMGTNETRPRSRYQKNLHRHRHSLRYESPVDGLLFLCRPSHVNPSSIGGSWNVSNLYKLTHALTHSSRSDDKTKIKKTHHDGWNEDTVLLSETEIWMQRYCR